MHRKQLLRLGTPKAEEERGDTDLGERVVARLWLACKSAQPLFVVSNAGVTQPCGIQQSTCT